MPSSERCHHLRKLLKTAQSFANMYWKRWTAYYRPQWYQRPRWSEELVQKLKFSIASRWLCETPWVPIGTNDWNLDWQQQCFPISKSQIAHEGLNRPVVIWAPVFYIVFPRTKTGPAILASLQITRLRWPLSFQWIQRAFLHRTRKCGC